ncbi:hypothetical protein PCANC_00280 [Puccinia coronata f. sp. avenae]|uniref:Uncharacterized protein n=1 Tax=Puccinia coronata f. sp. avenae TaxID=200324 RepID=A0A2N5W902_9BASI|nr:hypothetical protein PCANC_00280 [Puccinia coronata f. sp. avenae]
MTGPPNLDNTPGAYNYPGSAYDIAGAGNLPPLNLDVHPLLPDPGYEALVNRFLDPDAQPYGPPPHLPATTPTLTSKGLVRTRKPNRTPEQIQAAEAAFALKRQERANKAATKAADARIKAAQKAACNVVKAKDKESAACCLKWTLEASCKLLKFIRVQVKDQVDRSGSGNLFDALIRFALPHELYTLMVDVTACNAAANAAGQNKMEDTYNNLLAPLPTIHTGSDKDSDCEDNVGADVPPESPPTATPHRRRRQQTANLTDAECALDEDTPPPSQHGDADFTPPLPIDVEDDLASLMPPPPTPTANTPALTRTPTEAGARTPNQSVGATNAKHGKSRPPAATQWMLDERKRADDLRAKEQQESKACSNAKAQACLDQLEQAKLDRKDLLEQARLDRKAHKAAQAHERAEDHLEILPPGGRVGAILVVACTAAGILPAGIQAVGIRLLGDLVARTRADSIQLLGTRVVVITLAWVVVPMWVGTLAVAMGTLPVGIPLLYGLSENFLRRLLNPWALVRPMSTKQTFNIPNSNLKQLPDINQMVHKTKSDRGIRNSPHSDPAKRWMRSGRLANGPTTPVANEASLAHLSPSQMREAISDIWNQDLQQDVPTTLVDNESTNNELSTTKEGTLEVNRKPIGGLTAVIDEAMATDQDNELLTTVDGTPDRTVAPTEDMPGVNHKDAPVDVHPLDAPTPVEPNTHGEPGNIFLAPDPAPPVQGNNFQREQAIWDQLAFLARAHGNAPEPRNKLETAGFEGFLQDCHIAKLDQYTRMILRHHGITHWSYFRSSQEADLITNIGLSAGVARFLCVGASVRRRRCF